VTAAPETITVENVEEKPKRGRKPGSTNKPKEDAQAGKVGGFSVKVIVGVCKDGGGSVSLSAEVPVEQLQEAVELLENALG
jgi:hypothetical protein